MDIQGAIADQMGALTLHDVGGASVSVLFAVLLTYAAGLFARRTDREALHGHAAWAACIAAATVLVRGSLPLAVTLLAVLVSLRPSSDGTSADDRRLRLFALVAGVGCGSGASLIALVLLVPGAFLLRLASAPRSN
ncbi:MAG TPA: hypothetical protein VGE21_05085 [Flavobacteriales bacterium]